MSSPASVLVTGASRGLGRGIASELASAGYSVAIHYARNHAAAEAAAAECRQRAGCDAQSFPLIPGDLGQKEAREAVFDQTLAALGRIDALVNNAGMAPRARVDVTEASEASFDEVLAVNLKAPHFLTQRVARHWLAHPGEARLPGGYKLIFVGSISATTVSEARAEYCIAKAGLGMVNRLWASRLASASIQSIELRPGIMATDMTSAVKQKYDDLIENTDLVPQRRWGNAADVGYAVAAILGGSFPFTTGDVIHIDGGFHLRRL